MMKTILLATSVLAIACNAAEARHRHVVHIGYDPMCNITMPCTVPSSIAVVREEQRVARGKYVARQLGIGGVAPNVRSFKRRVEYTVTHIGNGIIRSVSGATAHVAASATSAFQCLVSKLDNQGYRIKFMGGWRAHGSVRGSLHPAGLALDINQYSRNITRPRMPSNEITLANSCGLISGAQWANGDSGHFQLGGYAGHTHNSRYAEFH